MGSLLAIPRTPSVPKSFCDTAHFREAELEINLEIRQRVTGATNAGRRSSPQRSGATSTFFLIRYQTAVATVKAINFARQLLRNSRFIASGCRIRFRQSVVRVGICLIAFAQEQL
jgi:hypothetical protein